jgi:hypothetical protein
MGKGVQEDLVRVLTVSTADREEGCVDHQITANSHCKYEVGFTCLILFLFWQCSTSLLHFLEI